MSLIADSIVDSDLLLTARGWEATRAFLVENAQGDSTSRLYYAALEYGIPRIGDPHPSIPGIRCVEVRARPETDSPTKARVVAQYRIPTEDELATSADGAEGDGRFELDSTTVADETFVDISGRLMTVTMRNPQLVNQSGESETINGVLTNVIQGAVERPQVTVRLIRTEQQLPIARQITFTGKINGAQWSGYAPKTWLCRSIGAEQDTGGRYKVTYELVYDPQTWRLRGAINVAGVIPSNATLGNGIEYFDVYAVTDFNQLGFTL